MARFIDPDGMQVTDEWNRYVDKNGTVTGVEWVSNKGGNTTDYVHTFRSDLPQASNAADLGTVAIPVVNTSNNGETPMASSREIGHSFDGTPRSVHYNLLKAQLNLLWICQRKQL